MPPSIVRKGASYNNSWSAVILMVKHSKLSSETIMVVCVCVLLVQVYEAL